MRYSFRTKYSEEDEAYIATCPEFPGLSAFGETPVEAMQEAEMLAGEFEELHKEDGMDLPVPQFSHSYSGQTRLRMPKSLHRALAQRAEDEGTSLNALMVSLLSGALVSGRLGDHKEDLTALISELRSLQERHEKSAKQLASITSSGKDAGTRVQDPIVRDAYPEGESILYDK